MFVLIITRLIYTISVIVRAKLKKNFDFAKKKAVKDKLIC